MKLVPEISVTSHGNGTGASIGVADAFMAKLLSGAKPDAAA
jgi:hypothetical protein